MYFLLCVCGGGCLGEEWRLVYFYCVCVGCVFGGGVEVSVFFLCVCGAGGGVGGGVEFSVFFTVCVWGGVFGGGVEVSVFLLCVCGLCVWGRSGG